METLIEALRNPVITEVRLAARLQRKHCVDPQVVYDPIQQLNQQVKERQIDVHQMKQQLGTRKRHLQAKDRTIEVLRQKLKLQHYIHVLVMAKKRRKNIIRLSYQGKKRHGVFSTFMPKYHWPNRLQ